MGAAMSDHANYVKGLPDASGTFTGTFADDAAITELLSGAPDLLPIEVDTGSQPNPAALPMTEFRIRIGEQEWVLPVDHVDLLGAGRVRIWVRRP
jgi:hypothetical protein